MLQSLNHLTLAVSDLQKSVTVWKQNKSEGASFYFLDPDGHKLELHVGSLAARLAACREKPYAGMVFTSDEA
nr:hypothetical protein [Enterobacter roggenkampii]